jgi:hypothetical protein
VAGIRIDSRTKLIHAVVVTPANVANSAVLPDLLHGNERSRYALCHQTDWDLIPGTDLFHDET